MMAFLSTVKQWARRWLQLDLKKKNYLSEIDNFLQEFDRTHPKRSLSQQKELKQATRIAKLRDHTHHTANPSKIWEEF
jgi:hypothetical protein